MPTGLGQATSGEQGSVGGGQPDPNNGSDVGNGSQSGGGTTVITPGGGPTTGYIYDIVSLYGGNGSAYVAMNNSNISCNSSVALFNRNNSFATVNTSAGSFSNCCSYGANKGFIAYDSSKVAVQLCIATLSAYNYSSIASSSMYVNSSASVFPFLFGTYVSNTSSFISNEYETMTSFMAENSPVPTHYRSGQNSYCTNSNVALSTKTSAGLSGPVINPRHVSFVWSQIWRNPSTNNGFTIQTGAGAVSVFDALANASYRYVPFTHCTDYYQLPFSSQGGGQNFNGANIDTAAFVLLYSQGRNCYTAVKPPWYMFTPEDASGRTGVTNLQGVYTVTQLIGSLQ